MANRERNNSDFRDLTQPLSKVDSEATVLLEEKTAILDNNTSDENGDEGTVFLGNAYGEEYDSIENTGNPVLIRTMNEKVIYLTGESFRLGRKSSKIDYFVDYNSSVSREHACIIRRNEQYFIKDLNSKNGTSVNGKRVFPDTEARLLSGAVIRIADEEFIFRYK